MNRTRGLIKRHRWLVPAFMAGALDGSGYHGPVGTMLTTLFFAAAIWTFAFDRGRAGAPRPQRDLVTPEQERWMLFAVAVLAAVVMAVSGTTRTWALAERGGSFTLDMVMALTIARQGYRIGSRRLTAPDYQDELIFGALGSLAIMLTIDAAVVAFGQVPSVAELMMMVVPVGLIALSDEPLYVTVDPYLRRQLMHLKRLREGIPDEIW